MNGPKIMAEPKDPRFAWKVRVRATPFLSNSAKHLGCHLVDMFIFQNGELQCWPSNARLAGELRLSIRQVQRQLKELEAQGWLVRVKRPGVRRAYELGIPKPPLGDIKGDTEGDIQWAPKVTKVTPEHDTDVTPYKKHEKKHEKARGGSGYALITVNEEETHYIAAWQAWVAEKTGIGWEAVKAKSWKDGAYLLPSRYPNTTAEAEKQALAFIDALFPSRIAS